MDKIQELITENPLESLRNLATAYPGQVAFSTSFGLEDQVITDLISKEKLPIRIFTLDTGRLFGETYKLWQSTIEKYSIEIEAFAPKAEDIQNYIASVGPNGFYDSIENRKECCRIRKLVPLQRALSGVKIWITGIRSEQSPERSHLTQLEKDEANRLWKFHPLLAWDLKMVQDYIKTNQVPYNILHDQGYPSIGCAPCTRAVQAGEDARAGRWWWEADSAKECGLHWKDGKLVPNKKEISDDKSIIHSSNKPLPSMTRLDQLESESIYILREVAAQFNRPVLLFSGGKDSITLVHLAKKAFEPGKIPFTLVHIDTGHNFPEALEFRDELVKQFDVKLEIGSVQESIDAGRAVEEKGKFPSRNGIQTVSLLETITRLKADACIGGARRDEEKARAKERIFSVRDVFGGWDPRLQRPELWNLYNGKIHNGENVRVFPISNWTELDVWEYIERENIKLPNLYFTHTRDVLRVDGHLFPVSEFVNLEPSDKVFSAKVRFRTVGDMTCTAAVESEANSLSEIIQEIRDSRTTERGSRLDDKRSEAAMEERKRGGYF